MMVQPVEKYDVEQGAEVGIAREVQWWEPGTHFYSKIVNTGSSAGKVTKSLCSTLTTLIASSHSLYTHLTPTGP